MKKAAAIVLGLAMCLSCYAEFNAANLHCIRIQGTGNQDESEQVDLLLYYEGTTSVLLGMKIEPGVWITAEADGLVYTSVEGRKLVIQNASNVVPGGVSVKDGKLNFLGLCIRLPDQGDDQYYLVWSLNNVGEFYYTDSTAAARGEPPVPSGTWVEVALPESLEEPIDGTYVHSSGLLSMRIQHGTFVMYVNTLAAGSGIVERQANMVTINDGKDIVLFRLMGDGSLETETYGLSGIWARSGN